jgi:anhydro-N-acetylmuramic acid kinase
VYHLPPQGKQNGFSLQLGCPDAIAAACNRPVIAQFRNADMAYGGQGAPLVPVVDALLFQHPTQWQAAHNLGGISNMTVLPPKNQPKAPLLGFDTGPANALIDSLALKHFNVPYDTEGAFAAAGQCDEATLAQLLTDPYFKQAPPKSTGRETFNLAFLERNPDFTALSSHDQLRTALELTVSSIEGSYKQLLDKDCAIKATTFSGGGTQNAFLMQRLRDVLHPLGIDVRTELPFGIRSQYKEALAFALLGAMTLLGRPNTLASVTGASHAAPGGAIWRYDLLSQAARATIGASRPE